MTIDSRLLAGLFRSEHPYYKVRIRTTSFFLVVLLCTIVGSLQAFTPIHRQLSTIRLPTKRSYDFRNTRSRGEALHAYPVAESVATEGKEANADQQPKGPGWVSADQLGELKDSADIISVIESYGLEGFERKGDNRAMAVCPFHNDRNPSLNIDGNRRMYKCFSCGAGGDVFNFVREFGKLKGQEMSFYEAVRHVSSEFGDGNIGTGSTSSSGGPRMSDEKRQELHAKKERVALANAAAATFYSQCLAHPSGGRARSHLQSRGLPAVAARAFALGYAPDVYFGGDRPNSQWGVGSLVDHLKDFEFTAQEILDSGLAIQTKKRDAPVFSSIEEPRQQLPTDSNTTKDAVLDYSSLMDRFRGRLIVPIFDASGKKVVGLGGRILPPPDQTPVTSDFKAPKYLNSPESLIFQKSSILFNEHMARDAVRKSQTAPGDKTRGVILVEGYMDAIALWGIGVKEVVASMGTAVSSDQLASVAKLSGSPGGRVILCLDNDEAGQIAVERLCGNGMLSEASIKHGVEFLVASLPQGLKDPADFIEAREGPDDEIANSFRTEIVGSACDWTDWYLQRLFTEYDPAATRGRPGSFGDIFERVAGFLASSMDPADRTKRAYEVAGSLAAMIAEEKNATEVSSVVRFQFESDLIDRASRIAEAKDAVQRRSESISGQSPTGTRNVLSSLSRGEGPSAGDDDSGKLSYKALSSNAGKVSTSQKTEMPAARRSSKSASSGAKSKKPPAQTKRRTFKTREPTKVVALTPHFAGFEFARQSDMDWLGIPKENWKRKRKPLALGYVAPNSKMVGGDGIQAVTQGNLVYFNSNDFHGHQFLTNDAIDAGYTSRPVKRDPSLLEKGVASLVEQDIGSMAVTAENSLLRVLVLHGAARTTAKNVIDARRAVSSGIDIEWTCYEKEWLFASLVEKRDMIPPDCHEPAELRSFLAALPDVPTDAFDEHDDAADRSTEQKVAPSEEGTEVTNIVDDGLEHHLSDTDPSNTLSADADNSSTDLSLVDASVEKNSPRAAGVTIPANDAINFDDVDTDESALRSAGFDDLDTEGSDLQMPDFDYVDIEGSDLQSPDFDDMDTDGAALHSADGVSNTPSSTQLAKANSLDRFFVPEDEYSVITNDGSASGQIRGELFVQELLATLLWATTSERARVIQKEFVSLFTTLNETTSIDGEDDSSLSSMPAFAGAADGDGGLVDSNNNATGSAPTLVEKEQMKSNLEELATSLRDTNDALRQLAESAKRISSRLMAQGTADGLEGRVSLALQEELANHVDAHLTNLVNLPPMERGTSPRDLMLGDDRGDEPYEDTLERMEEEWGEWWDEDFVWSPEAAGRGKALGRSHFDDKGDSILDACDDPGDTFDEDMARIDREWEGWND